MTYTVRNFKTKKELKNALFDGEIIELQDPIFGANPIDGIVFLEGPHYPAAHSWYASAVVENGKVIRVS